MSKRYFEFHGADAKRGTTSSSKFWEVWIEGSTLYTRFGKIGANGQTTVKEFPTPEDAEAALEKAAKEKTKKGYVEENTGALLGEIDSGPKVPNHAETLKRAQSPNATKAELEQLFREYRECAEGENPCQSCDDEVDFDLESDALDVLASNPNIHSELLDSAITAAQEWQGKIVGVAQRIAGNPAITEEGKNLLLATENYLWHVFDSEIEEDYAEEYAKRIGKAIRGNPKFSLEEGVALAIAIAVDFSDRERFLSPGEIYFDSEDYPVIWDYLRDFWGNPDASELELRIKNNASNPAQPGSVFLRLVFENETLTVEVGHNSAFLEPDRLFIDYEWEELEEKVLLGEKTDFAHFRTIKHTPGGPSLGKAFATVCEALWPLPESQLTITAENSGSKISNDLQGHRRIPEGLAPKDAPVEPSVGSNEPSCSSCGEPLIPGAKFCSICGKEAAPPVRFCSQCGTELAPGTRFCPQCGAPTNAAVVSQEDDSEESAETDISALCQWILGAIEPLPRQAKTKRIDFLAYEQSTLVFSVEFAYDVFDFRLNESLLDLDTLLGDGYPEFTDKDSVEPRTFIHAYWNVEDWGDLGPELVEDIVRMIDSQQWVRSTVGTGMLGDKVKVERWM